MKRALIVVDFQKDFVDGSLGFPKAEELEKPICEKITAYRRRGDEIIFTFDTHDENYASTMEGKKLPIPHCLKGSEGWKLYGKVAELWDEKDVCIEKPSFGSLELADYLRHQQFDQVELVGVVSNICVISNAILSKAALPEAEIIVDPLCTAGNDEELNQMALKVMEGLQITIPAR